MIYHIFHDFISEDPETNRRNDFARQTWMELSFGIINKPIPLAVLPRAFSEGSVQMSYAKDVIDAGCDGLLSDDLVILTNLDTCVAPNFPAVLFGVLDNFECGWAGRRDLIGPLTVPLDNDEIKAGGLYPGTDLFFFRKSWWSEFRDQMPDLIMGAEAWDFCLRELLKRSGRRVGEIHDVIYHEVHPAAWCQDENIRTWESQKHCIKLAKEFLKDPELIAQLSETTRPAQ